MIKQNKSDEIIFLKGRDINNQFKEKSVFKKDLLIMSLSMNVQITYL